MNKKTLLTASIIVGGYLLLLLICFLVNSDEAKNILVLLGIFGGATLLVIGTILSFFDSTRYYGLGFVLAGVLIFIIGCGVCSANFKI